LTANDIRALTPFVDANRVYHTHATQREADVQIHIISVLGHAATKGGMPPIRPSSPPLIHNLSFLENHRKVLLEGGFLEKVMGFFEPLKVPSIEWDFDLIDAVLSLLNNLLQNGSPVFSLSSFFKKHSIFRGTLGQIL